MTRPKPDNHCLTVLVYVAVVVILLSCAARLACGQTQAHPAVVRVGNQVSGATCYGTGTLIAKNADHAIVVTCYHVFRNDQTGQTEIGQVTCCFTGQGCFPAEVVAVDPLWDLAALKVSPPQAEPVAIASAHARPGETITFCGYGSGQYSCGTGIVNGYVQPKENAPSDWLDWRGVLRDGDSGGPVFNTAGELVAVSWGTNAGDNRSCGAFCGRVRKFLGRLLGINRRAPPGGVIVQGDPLPAPGTIVPGLDPGIPLPGPERPLGPVSPNPKPPAPSVPTDLLDRLAAIEKLRPRIEAAAEAVSEPKLRGLIGEIAAGLVDESAGPAATSILPAVLAALGVSFPPGLAALAVAWLARRGVKRLEKRRRRFVEIPSPRREPSDLDETPPPAPPPLPRREREFVEVEIPEKRLRALEWAHDEYVRRFPGARATVESIEQFANQYESGMR